MAEQTTGGVNIPEGADIMQQIEANKTKLFLEAYKELCKEYNRVFVPSFGLQFLPPEQTEQTKETKKDANNTPNKSNSSK